MTDEYDIRFLPSASRDYRRLPRNIQPRIKALQTTCLRIRVLSELSNCGNMNGLTEFELANIASSMKLTMPKD